MRRYLFAFMFVVLLGAGASASDASAGLRLSIGGGPLLSPVVDQRLSPETRVNFAVGGFPGIILGIEANVRLIPEKKK